MIIFDAPTRGVDVGAIAEIHVQINRLADAGRAVVWADLAAKVGLSKEWATAR